MINDALIFLCETFFGLFIYALLLRFYMQLFRAPSSNPLSNFVISLTNFMVIPARRIIPGLRKIDWATLVLAWALQFILFLILYWLSSGFTNIRVSFIALILLSVIQLFKLSLYLLIFIVLAQAILSWVSPYNPLMPLLNTLTFPFLNFLRRRIPPIGSIDLSPLFVFVICQLIIMLPLRWLEQVVARF